MKHLFKATSLTVGLITIFSGCGRIVDWGAYTFEQSDALKDMTISPREYVRSITVYDQFDTVAIFDALWLSDDARTGYVDLFVRRRGKSEEFRNTFLRRQLEENKHFFNVYVLAPFDLPMGEQNSVWQVFLDIDGIAYNPVEFKVAELETEYRAIFGKRYTRFKEAYLVKFDAKNNDGKPIFIPGTTQKISLYFRSNDKQVVLTWLVDQSGKVIVESTTKYGAPLQSIKHDKNCDVA